jgi:hypothetical protein
LTVVASQAILGHLDGTQQVSWHVMIKKHGYICMTQRQKNNLRSRDTMVHHIQKFQTQKPASRLMASVFLGKDGTLLAEYLEKGVKITESYYTALLDKVKQALVSKRLGKQPGEVLFLQDNASSHTRHKLAGLDFGVLKHSTYLPYLAPSA